MKFLNSIYNDEAKIKELHESFKSGKPYPHIIMDNFLDLDLANSLESNFPSPEKLDIHYKGLNEKKSEGADFSRFHPDFSTLKAYLMSPEFYEWTSKVTGIKDVFITDDNMGMGVHSGGDGSHLDIHVDFNIHPTANVHRRLNLLIYLNKDWKPEYNGSFELWNQDVTVCEKYVEPLFNRCVIFETSEISYHGYTKKLNLPEGVRRKSVYAYFYTHEREGAAAYHDTIFKAIPTDSTSKKVGTVVKENIKNFVKSNLKKMGVKFYKI